MLKKILFGDRLSPHHCSTFGYSDAFASYRSTRIPPRYQSHEHGSILKRITMNGNVLEPNSVQGMKYLSTATPIVVPISTSTEVPPTNHYSCSAGLFPPLTYMYMLHYNSWLADRLAPRPPPVLLQAVVNEILDVDGEAFIRRSEVDNAGQIDTNKCRSSRSSTKRALGNRAQFSYCSSPRPAIADPRLPPPTTRGLRRLTVAALL